MHIDNNNSSMSINRRRARDGEKKCVERSHASYSHIYPHLPCVCLSGCRHAIAIFRSLLNDKLYRAKVYSRRVCVVIT